MFNPRTFVKQLPESPGVYQMMNHRGNVIYVGKAKNLKKRVSSYFSRTNHGIKEKKLIEHIANIEVIITSTENQALVLENDLIKKFRPRYNVLFRDDKSYPYIYLNDAHAFPSLVFYRGKKKKGRYFGPYPNAQAVRETLNLLQKCFRIRQCSDPFFASRGDRPCLQYQIKRCTAPCVNFIDQDTYKKDLNNALLFLQGKSSTLIDQLIQLMNQASQALNYELAARYRDQIAGLKGMQTSYSMKHNVNTDVISVFIQARQVCVYILYIREGRLLGSKPFYLETTLDNNESELLSAFIPQHYLNSGLEIPHRLIMSHAVQEKNWLIDTLSESAGYRVTISESVSGIREKWRLLALKNAKQSLNQYLQDYAHYYQQFESLQKVLQLSQLPKRCECIDISHSHGEACVASCVVFDLKGPVKRDYRRFNVKGVTAGDDYAAIKHALLRHYTKMKERAAELPDILFIDGGRGQLKQAEWVIEELQLVGIALVAIAKGEGRKPGLESLWLSGQADPIRLPADSIALHLIQRIRDEAHRFAITAQRKQLLKSRQCSPLENIPGIGPKKRQTLLAYFGGLQRLKQASVDEIGKIPGINQSLAMLIHKYVNR